MNGPSSLSMGTQALHDAFDASFARRVEDREEGWMDFLAIQSAGTAYALQVDQLASLETARRVQPLPGGRPGLMGLAGVRGRLVPVFALGALLGHPEGAQETRWLAVVGREDPLGFAFPQFEGYLRVSPEALAPVAEGTAGPWIKACLRDGGLSRPIVNLAALVEDLYNRSGLKAR